MPLMAIGVVLLHALLDEDHPTSPLASVAVSTDPGTMFAVPVGLNRKLDSDKSPVFACANDPAFMGASGCPPGAATEGAVQVPVAEADRAKAPRARPARTAIRDKKDLFFMIKVPELKNLIVKLF